MVPVARHVRRADGRFTRTGPQGADTPHGLPPFSICILADNTANCKSRLEIVCSSGPAKRPVAFFPFAAKSGLRRGCRRICRGGACPSRRARRVSSDAAKRAPEGARSYARQAPGLSGRAGRRSARPLQGRDTGRSALRPHPAFASQMPPSPEGESLGVRQSLYGCAFRSVPPSGPLSAGFPAPRRHVPPFSRDIYSITQDFSSLFLNFLQSLVANSRRILYNSPVPKR